MDWVAEPRICIVVDVLGHDIVCLVQRNFSYRIKL